MDTGLERIQVYKDFGTYRAKVVAALSTHQVEYGECHNSEDIWPSRRGTEKVRSELEELADTWLVEETEEGFGMTDWGLDTVKEYNDKGVELRARNWVEEPERDVPLAREQELRHSMHVLWGELRPLLE